jgi:hypothetical protein
VKDLAARALVIGSMPLQCRVGARLRRHGVEFLAATVVLAASGASTLLGGQSVRGRVVDAVASTPIPDANLQLVDDGGRMLEEVRSDSAGWFTLSGDRGRGDNLRVIARRIGFYAAMIRLPSIGPDDRTELLVSMRRLVLDTVRVAASGSKARTLGLNPNSLAVKPITRDFIERELTRTGDLPSLLRRRQIAGVWVEQSGCVRIHMTGSCALLVVDGVPRRDASTVNLADVDEVLVLHANEAGVLFGSRAAGGALVVFTLAGPPRR